MEQIKIGDVFNSPVEDHIAEVAKELGYDVFNCEDPVDEYRINISKNGEDATPEITQKIIDTIDPAFPDELKVTVEEWTEESGHTIPILHVRPCNC